MLEGDSSVQSGTGTDEGASVPSAATGSPTGQGEGLQGTAGGADSSASAGDGSAPVPGGDASLVADVTQAAPAAPAQTPSEFLFGGRKFRDQKHAEDFFRSQVGRVPDTQRKIAEFERTLAEREQTIQALQRAMATGQPPGQGQGAADGSAAPAGPHGFAEKLVKSGDLEFITNLLNDPDPAQGIQKFVLGLADRMDREWTERMDGLVSERIEPIVRQREFERHMGRSMSVAKNLGSDFPELDSENQSPEAIEHQQAYLENVKRIPPEVLAQDPEYHLLAAALMTRHQYGIPIVAQEPGTSGSPSARAALASEQALAAATGTPLEGTGTPRPRPNGQGETPLDRIRRENAAAPTTFRSPTGRDLGFGPA